MATLDLGNGYHIDLAEAEKLVRALQATYESLQRSLDVTASDLQVLGPGNDDASSAFAFRYNDVIQQHAAWNIGKQQELRDLINKVNAAVASYRQSEYDNTMRV